MTSSQHTIFALTLSLSCSLAQDPPTPLGGLDASKLPDISLATGQAAQAAPPASAGAPQATAPTPSKPAGPSFLGMELPFLDPSSEVLSWNGNTWNVVNNRMFGARFEKYLNSPSAEAKEDLAYRDTLRQILDALSPQQEGKEDLAKAVALLPIAASYYHDAHLCESLSNTIYGIWLAQRNIIALKKANKVLQKEAKQQLWNANLSAELSEMDKKKGAKASAGSSNQTTTASSSSNNTPGALIPGDQALGNLTDSPEGKYEFAQEKFDSASWTSYYLKKATEYETMAAKNKLGMVASDIQQKLEFQGLIMQYFMQRRFEHVIIACRIYRQLFKDGDTVMKMDSESALYKSFKFGSGMNPTVTTFDALANEAIRDVDEGVQAFDHLAAKGELEGATKRLSEAFAVGEYLPRIRTLPMEKKAQVLEFVQHSNQLLSAIDVKNYHLAKELVEKMKTNAQKCEFIRFAPGTNPSQAMNEMYQAFSDVVIDIERSIVK